MKRNLILLSVNFAIYCTQKANTVSVNASAVSAQITAHRKKIPVFQDYPGNN